jgi:hypothetical protein
LPPSNQLLRKPSRHATPRTLPTPTRDKASGIAATRRTDTP